MYVHTTMLMMPSVDYIKLLENILYSLKPAMSVPQSLSSVNAYLTKANELDKDTNNPDSKIVAFSCRKFAMEKAMTLNDNSPEVKQFLFSLMDTLEKEKSSLSISAADRQLVCEKFAFKVFAIADEEDRAGLASKDTARTFNAARIFFEILEQFGEVSSEVEEKRKYAKFKTVDILKAIKEGRKPAVGAPGEDIPPPSDRSENEDTSNISAKQILPTAMPEVLPVHVPIFPPVNPTPIAQYTPPPPKVTHTIPTPNISNLSIASTSTNSKMMSSTDPRSKDLIELCNFAIAALKKNDTVLARERLEEALRRMP